VKREKAKGQKALSQWGWRHNDDKILPFLAEGVPDGTQT